MAGFQFVRKWPGDGSTMNVEYRASFWDGPVEAGANGKRAYRLCRDTWFPPRILPATGERFHGRFLSTARSASYYPDLLRAAGFKE